MRTQNKTVDGVLTVKFYTSEPFVTKESNVVLFASLFWFRWIVGSTWTNRLLFPYLIFGACVRCVWFQLQLFERAARIRFFSFYCALKIRADVHFLFKFIFVVKRIKVNCRALTVEFVRSFATGCLFEGKECAGRVGWIFLNGKNCSDRNDQELIH